jgi:4-amino-4-deoxy-L-arabinose transferase-like glycosyltransferase
LALAALLAKDIGEPYVQDWDEGLYLCSVREALNGQPFFTSIYNGQAPAFLDILTLSMRLFGESVSVARGTILFFFLLSLVGVGWIAWRVACPLAAPVAMVLLGLSLAYFRQSTIVQAEIMSLSFALLSIGLLLSCQHRSRLWLLPAGFLFTLGVLCKVFIITLALAALLLLLQDRRSAGVGSTGKTQSFASETLLRLWLFGLGCLAWGAIAVVAWDLPALFNQVVMSRFAMRDEYALGWSGNEKVIVNLLLNDPMLPLLAVAGFGYLLWKDIGTARWLIIWILPALFFLLDHRPFYARHIVLLLPPLAVAASASTLWVASAIAGGGKLIGFMLLFLLFGIVSFMLRQDIRLLAAKQPIPQSEREVIRLIQQNTQESDFIVSDEQMHVFLSGRRMPPWLCDSADNRIRSGYLSDEEAIQTSESARMVIFATRRLAMLHKYVRWVEANYDLIRAFDNPATKVYLRRGPTSR